MGAILYKDKVYGAGGSIIEGYYKLADGKFYEEDTYTTEILGAEDLLYIDLTSKMQFIFDGTNFVNITEDAKPTVTEASSRTNIASGDTLKTIIGKIKKFFSDLKAVAFSGSYNDLSDKPTIPTITDTYSGTSSDGMSGKAVKSAIDALDGTVSGSAGAGKTLTAFSQTDGKVTATFGDISITKSQVSNMPTKLSDFTNDLTLLKAVDFTDGTAYVPQTEHLSAMIASVRENNANIGLGSNTFGGNILAVNWGNGNWKYNTELYMGCGDKPVMYFRGKNTSQTDAYCDWRQIVQGHKDVQKYYDKQTVDLSSLDVNTFYPVTGTAINSWYVGYVHMTLSVALNSGTKPSWSTHDRGFSVFIDILNEAQGWGATVGTGICLANQFSWCAASPCGYSQMGNSSTPVFWCRGGGKYFIYSDHPMTWTIRTSTYTASGQSVAPRSTNPGVSFYTTPNIVANITGKANALSNTSAIGSDVQTPIYFDANGHPSTCYNPASGAWFRGIPFIGSNGVMEIGKYIDFHDSNTSTTDYDARITASTSGLTLSGTTTGTFSGNLSGTADKATKDGDGNTISSTYMKVSTQPTLIFDKIPTNSAVTSTISSIANYKFLIFNITSNAYKSMNWGSYIIPVAIVSSKYGSSYNTIVVRSTLTTSQYVEIAFLSATSVSIKGTNWQNSERVVCYAY